MLTGELGGEEEWNVCKYGRFRAAVMFSLKIPSWYASPLQYSQHYTYIHI
jgi:hypothetical protein